MNPQVLTSARSASSIPSASANPAPSRSPTSRSLSARFFAQPSETRATRPIGRDEADAMGTREGTPADRSGRLRGPALPVRGGEERGAAAGGRHLTDDALG